MSPKEFLNTISKPMLNNLKYLNKSYVAVGIVGDIKYPVKSNKKDYGVTLLQVANCHEFGTDRLPKRSFLREPFKQKKKDINNTINSQYKKVIDKKTTVDKALNIIGVKATNISKRAFRDGAEGVWVPLSPETIKRKGSSKILIDTGFLRNSITWQVR